MKNIPLLITIFACIISNGCKDQSGSISTKDDILNVHEDLYPLIDGMSLIKGGTFKATIDFDTNEVFVRPFYIDKFEVTISEFEKFVQETGYIPDSEKEGSKVKVLGSKGIESKTRVTWRYDERGNIRERSNYDHPVIYISYNDAASYAKWAGKRLPTIVEWSFIVEKGYGDADPHKFWKNVSWFNGNSDRIQKAGQISPDCFGLFDIVGNVGEFVETADYKSTLPEISSNSNRIRYVYSSFFCEEESLYPPVFAIGTLKSMSFNIGFRCAKDLDLVYN
jgi:sulfatase modifying factor 1